MERDARRSGFEAGIRPDSGAPASGLREELMGFRERMAWRVAVAGVVVGLAAVAVGAKGSQPAVNVSKDGLAIDGFDAVAYVTDAHPVKGTTQFETRWNGALWRFSSAVHRDAFMKEPERYAPQF